MKIAGIVFASLLTASAASAAPAQDISLGVPGYGGSGCPSDSVSATISPDGKALSLLFDNYVVEAGGETGKSFDRKTCNVAIPVHVPQGRSVSVLAIDYRGFNQLPRGARSQFNVEYFFAGTRGPSFTRSFNGPTEKDYLISNKLVAESLIWSACGEDVNLRTNSSIRVNTNGRQQAMATVDTQDVKAAIVYQLQWRTCR
ncbi:DUF4360 domain-containing protein [Aliirhizobium smilacinae]|uniref:DUF4360 domain-containing protein n=1 Tax=Aliirhizobium smilacinae TaxID=1395944 RepID=A0A5C4XP74_9HYPH|nr:DUF4360 domain-containing protein [Rhizobium smilacinae]TNM65285.1 DUF4360 domain-containing protein [Rhizobium smilacinae]